MTSIEWLVEELDELIPYEGITTSQVFTDILIKAQEMHKQEIVKAFDEAYMSGYRDNGNDGINYYNETFKKD